MMNKCDNVSPNSLGSPAGGTPRRGKQTDKGVESMSRKILIIDDDPYIVKYLVDILEDDGFATCTASNVEEALALLKEEKPDLITLDLEMPNEWGPRFYRKMVMDPANKDIPVIVVSGLSGIHLAIKNAVASFKKPFNPQELLEAIKKALD